MLRPKSSSNSRVGSAKSNAQGIQPLSQRVSSLVEAGFERDFRIDPAECPTSPVASIQTCDTTQHDRKLDAELAHALADNLPDHAVVMLDAAGKIVRWNFGAAKLLGFTDLETLGRSPTLFLAPTPDAAPQSTSTAAAGDDLRDRDALLIRRNGSMFPARLTFAPLADDHPGGGFALIIHDVSERNRADGLLRDRLAETAHLARLSSIGQMVAEFAHEINQPLAAAANYARACINYGRSGQCVVAPEAIEWMDRCATQAMRAVSISKRLGSFVKKSDGEPTLVPINSLVDQSMSLIRSMLQAGDASLEPIALDTLLDPANPTVYADPVQVEQVLLNLMRNAVEAMHESKGRRHKLSLNTKVEGPCVVVTVGDTGPGIPADRQAGLFDPFRTTKSTGLGLGLSISRSIVEQHGGRMTVESSQAGTVFSFTLPLPPGGCLPCRTIP